jgi:hypothetical protein
MVYFGDAYFLSITSETNSLPKKAPSQEGFTDTILL